MSWTPAVRTNQFSAVVLDGRTSSPRADLLRLLGALHWRQTMTLNDILGSSQGRIVFSDNLEVLNGLPNECLDLIYVDPPFNTGKRQTLQRIKTIRDGQGDRVGFQGQRYKTVKLSNSSYV